MSKAKKSKAESGSGHGEKEKKDRFVWSTWDSILLDLLTAIRDAGMDSRENKEPFADVLPIKLASNGDLVTKVKANPKLAERIINTLPCGHRSCYDFIREVCQTR